MWDTEVDVVVIGAGLGGLANAIATVDAGGEVLVAAAIADGSDVSVGSGGGGDSTSGTLRERVGTRHGWLVHDTVDLETNEYFDAVAGCVLDVPVDAGDGSVPQRSARNLTREEAFGRHVETFVGARLAGWAARCIASPYGLLYTSMQDWRSTTMKSATGESIEASSIGAIEWADGFGPSDLRQWMAAQARERDIEVEPGSTLERIVFEEGVIAGVVLTTSEGPLAVRVRAGVTFGPGDQDAYLGETTAVPGDRLQVCIVGRDASRFARVELMATEPATPSRPTCTGSRRQVREGLHDARLQNLEGWRCGKVHGYPALG
jgi:hypothetical protein